MPFCALLAGALGTLATADAHSDKGELRCVIAQTSGSSVDEFLGALCSAVEKELTLVQQPSDGIALHIQVLSDTSVQAYLDDGQSAGGEPLYFQVVDRTLLPSMAAQFSRDLVFQFNTDPNSGSNK